MENKYSKNFKVINEIGSGSYGRVFKVKDKRDNIIYAMKIIDLTQTTVEEKLKFFNESEIISALDNPCIIKYKESFEEEGKLFLISEYASGGNMKIKLEKAKDKGIKFSDNQILIWLSQMCLGLSHIHSKNIIHRDLKLENILVTFSNSIKISDFGLSVQLPDFNSKANKIVGSELYIAPEVYSNKGYNKSADLWSLGIILYQLATFDIPYESKDDFIKWKLKKVPDYVSKDISDIINQLLQIDPNKRISLDDILDKQCIVDSMSSFNEKASTSLEHKTLLRSTKKEVKNSFALLIQKILNNDLEIEITEKIINIVKNSNFFKKCSGQLDPNIYKSEMHIHTLKKMTKNNIICDECEKEYNDNIVSYFCPKCDYDLCEKCVEIEKKIQK